MKALFFEGVNPPPPPTSNFSNGIQATLSLQSLEDQDGQRFKRFSRGAGQSRNGQFVITLQVWLGRGVESCKVVTVEMEKKKLSIDFSLWAEQKIMPVGRGWGWVGSLVMDQCNHCDLFVSLLKPLHINVSVLLTTVNNTWASPISWLCVLNKCCGLSIKA